MKRRRRNAKAAPRKKKQPTMPATSSQDNFEEMPITIKVEVPDEVAMDVDPLAVDVAVETEPSDVSPVFERILLPECLTAGFVNENQEYVTVSSVDVVSAAAINRIITADVLKQELKEEITSDMWSEEKQIKAEVLDSRDQTEVDMQQMMDGLSVCEELSEPATQQMLQEHELKIDIDEHTWSQALESDSPPGVNLPSPPLHCDDTHIESDNATSEQISTSYQIASGSINTQVKRTKKQPRRATKKLCNVQSNTMKISENPAVTAKVTEKVKSNDKRVRKQPKKVLANLCDATNVSKQTVSTTEDTLATEKSSSGCKRKIQPSKAAKKLKRVQFDSVVEIAHEQLAISSTSPQQDNSLSSSKPSQVSKRKKEQMTKVTKKNCTGTAGHMINPYTTATAGTQTQNNKNEQSDAESSTSESSILSDFFVCHLCGTSYTCIENFNKHVTKNHKNYLYCAKCKYLIKSNNKAMMKSHETTCCKLTSNILAKIIRKMKQKSRWVDESCDEESDHFLCHLCDEHFSCIQALNTHVSENHKKYKYCKKCKLIIKVVNSTELEKHDRECCALFKNTTCVSCNICAKSFLSVAKMLKHVAAKHCDDHVNKFNYSPLVIKVRVFKCTYCIAVYQKESEIETHVVEQHLQNLISKDGKRPFRTETFIKCIYCDACYSNFKNVTTHISSHHSEKSNMTSMGLDSFKLETGSQTVGYIDLHYLEYLYKLKKMKYLHISNDKSDLKENISENINEKCSNIDDNNMISDLPQTNASSKNVSTNASSKNVSTNASSEVVSTNASSENVSTNASSKNVSTNASSEVVSTNASSENVSTNASSKNVSTNASREIVSTNASTQKYNILRTYSSSVPKKIPSTTEHVSIQQIETKFANLRLKNDSSNIKNFFIYCSTCNVEYTDSEYMSSHMKTNPVSNCHCPFCKNYFYTPLNFVKHLEIHDSFMGVFPCNKCDGVFYSQSNLACHIINKHPNMHSIASQQMHQCGDIAAIAGTAQNKTQQTIVLRKVNPAEAKLQTAGQSQCIKLLPTNVKIQTCNFPRASPQFLSSVNSGNVKYVIISSGASRQSLNTPVTAAVELTSTNTLSVGNVQANMAQSDPKHLDSKE